MDKLQFYQPQNGYCYNSDTYFLCEFIVSNLKIFKNIQGELLDIGSGSGILGILLKKQYTHIKLNSCEIQEIFSFLTTKNALINNVALNLYHDSFLEKNFEKQFDILVSNPPFYPHSVVQTTNENINIARYNNHLPLKDFIKKSASILKQKGKFFFCYDVKLLDDIIIYLKEYKLNLESLQFLHPKKDKKASLVMVYARKNSNSMIDILAPIIMFDKNEFSSETKSIYSKYNNHSIKVEL